MKRLIDYRSIVGDKVIADIYKKAQTLNKKRILNINSTYAGGGVAEILSSLVPLMNDAGVRTDWRVIRGTPDLFNITKKFHNALQGDSLNLTRIKKQLYLQANEDFSQYAYIDHDFVVVHDPQPLPLIQYYSKQQPWVWRGHIDLSHPNKELWEFLMNYIIQYDKIIVSSEDYARENIPVEQVIFQPVIDPLTPKNKPLSDADVQKYLKKFEIPVDKPIMLQISRFDKWKDPLGVIEIYKKVKKKIDCRLILCGSMASDDPEGVTIYEMVKRKANDDIEKGNIILITYENNILVNILQRVAAVVLQKSLREGFGLTVTEALWKGRPVIASDVGGIPLQIKDEETGILVHPKDFDYTAERIVDIINNPKPYEEMGRAGKEYVRENFLVTRLMGDYFDLAASMIR
jgi:trehalose synthase